MINKFKQRINSDPFFGPNIWLLKTVGLVLPDSLLGKMFVISVHEIATFFVVTQYIELYIIRSNFDLVLMNLKISMLSIICVVKANTCVYWQKKWKEVIDYVLAADNFERNTNDPIKLNILKKYTRYCNLITYCYWVLVFSTVLTTCGTPLMYYMSSSSYRESLRNGTEPLPHIFSSWMPIDKTQSPGYWITIAWHTLICIYGASVVLAYDTSVVVIMVFFQGKLDLFRERCNQILGMGDVPVSDTVFNENIRELHETHVQILKYSRQFNSLLSPVMFAYIVLCSLMLCASAYQFTSESNTAQRLLIAEYLMFGITQLFIFCWHSDGVLSKFENVMLGPYESQWWAANVRQKKSVLLLAGQLRLTKAFTAGPFTNLTLSTFISILKGAYSYYTLLRK